MSGGLTLVTAGHMKRPFASGGYSDVWKAKDDVGQIFAIKQLRIYVVNDFANVKKVCTSDRSVIVSSPEPLSQSYCKEVTICRRIKHENLLGIVGVAPGLFELCMVSKWMDNGNMLQYVRDHKKVDRLHLVSLPVSLRSIGSFS